MPEVCSPISVGGYSYQKEWTPPNCRLYKGVKAETLGAVSLLERLFTYQKFGVRFQTHLVSKQSFKKGTTYLLPLYKQRSILFSLHRTFDPWPGVRSGGCGGGGDILISYFKAVNKKSVSDPEHLVCTFRIQLITMNIKNQSLTDWVIWLGWVLSLLLHQSRSALEKGGSKVPNQKPSPAFPGWGGAPGQQRSLQPSGVDLVCTEWIAR